MKFPGLFVPALSVGLFSMAWEATRPLSGQTFAQTQSPAGTTPSLPTTAVDPFQVPQPMHAPFLGGRNFFTQYGQNDPEMVKMLTSETLLNREAAELVGEYSKTENDAERAKLKTKLSTTLEKQFDAQQKRRELEITHVEAQLKKLRQLVQKRTEAKQMIIEKRLEQVVREAEGLGWNSPEGAASSNFLIAPRPFGGTGR